MDSIQKLKLHLNHEVTILLVLLARIMLFSRRGIQYLDRSTLTKQLF